jgi:prepilin-type N-terminal cleavage/methylation domain-containing protein
MKLNPLKVIVFNKPQQSEQGFSLVETMIALTTLGVCLAYAMPLFLYAKINNSKSEIRTGALIVSQRVFDNIRSKSFANMPINDGFNSDNLTGCSFAITPGAGRIDTSNGNRINLINCANATTKPNPMIAPADLTSPSASEKLQTYAMGRQYQTVVTFCQGIAATPEYKVGSTVISAAIPADPAVCTDKYRKFKVEVSYNGSKVYDLEGNYTEFQ